MKGRTEKMHRCCGKAMPTQHQVMYCSISISSYRCYVPDIVGDFSKQGLGTEIILPKRRSRTVQTKAEDIQLTYGCAHLVQSKWIKDGNPSHGRDHLFFTKLSEPFEFKSFLGPLVWSVHIKETLVLRIRVGLVFV